LEPELEQLKEKAILLLQRERELFELRMKYERVTIWLKLTQALPHIFDQPELKLSDTLARLRKVLLDHLRLQRVTFFEIDGQSLKPVAPAGAPRPLTSEALALLQSDAIGFFNDPVEGPGATLAESLGLARFLWSRIDVRGGATLVLAAGYDRSKAKFNPPFDEGEAAHLRNAIQHIQGLIRNASLIQEVRAANENLEERVVERTKQLERRNSDMRLVLDNVTTALLTIDSKGHLAPERSAKVDQWFAPYQGTPRFADYIAETDPKFAEHFAMAHESFIDDFLPRELCLHQMPRRLQRNGRVYQCSYHPIAQACVSTVSEDGAGLLLMIADITEEVRLAQEEAEQSELLAVFQGLARDRSGFLSSFEEANHLVQEILKGQSDSVLQKRYLHTLKGNSGLMGAKVVASLCHQAEDALALDGVGLTDILARLGQRWAAITQTLEMVLGNRQAEVVEVPISVLEQLCRSIDEGMGLVDLQGHLRMLSFEPVERPLARLGQYAKALAERMGKPGVVVRIESDGGRVDRHQLGALWATLVHIVRNAVDHGIESPDERTQQNKPAHGLIHLQASSTPEAIEIDIEDDGRGIDWTRVAQVAAKAGLPHGTEKDLMAALFRDGITTRQTVTETSGRGVGLSSVLEALNKLGGSITVTTKPGQGTRWRIRVPLANAVGHLASSPSEDSTRPC